MSKNLSQLARRQGIDNTLFQKLVVTDAGDKSANLKQQRQTLAKEFLMGEAVIHGAASFYDFLDDGSNNQNANKKAYVCNGSSCLCAQTQVNIKEKLVDKFGAANVGHITCLGRCAENGAFQVDEHNFSGTDINNLAVIANEADTASNEHYQVRCTLPEPILSAEISDVAKYYQLFNELSKQFVTREEHEQLLDKLVESGLRGRGGAGFPTGIKWRSCLNEQHNEKYIVCNADEGDAGAFSDRYLLEQRPHAVLFGMLMSGFLTGAKIGVLYIRAEYPVAITQTEQAISEFEQLGLATDFNFKIIKGAGAYICGEETALLRSIEGQRPVVSVRPPFPTQSGLFGCPTVVNNVETFGSIHYIFSNLSENKNSGVEKYKNLGNGKSTGSKLLSLDGSFTHSGIIEVAMGTPLTEIIELAGGFTKDIKALHIGGPLGGVVPLGEVHKLTIDFESFAQNGFLLGHASIIGVPESMKMIDYIAHLFEFTALESCGKCYPCQIGAVRGQEMFEQAVSGEQLIDSELLNDLLETMQLGSLCALGGGVPLPIQNILKYFEHELTPYFSDKEIAEGAHS